MNAAPMKPSAEPGWRLALAADAIAAPAYGRALEPSADALSAFETGPGGPWKIEAIYAARPDRAELEARLALAAASLGRAPPAIVFEPLPATDWLAANRRDFPPLAVGRFWIRGRHVREAAPAGAWAITLDAGMAFGSGEHATTRGCLLAIAAVARRRRPRLALDLGCGSAILAIGLARAGARRVLASDIDPDSVAVARENLARNGVTRRVRAVAADGLARLTPRRGYDLAVANILAGPLTRLATPLARALARGGRLVLSGLLVEQEREVVAAYRARRLALVARARIDGWSTLEFARR